jgi:hypothetical protein
MSFKSVFYRVINSTKDPGVDVASQQAIVTQGLYSGPAPPEIIDDGIFIVADGGDGGTGSDDNASFHGGWAGLFASGEFYIFNIGNNVVDCPDAHGLFLFLAGEGKAQDGEFNFSEKLNGINTVKTMVVPEIVVQARFFKFKIFGENR